MTKINKNEIGMSEGIPKDISGVKRKKEYLIKVKVRKEDLNEYLKSISIKPNEQFRKALLGCLENSAYAIVESDIYSLQWGKEHIKEKIDMGY